MIGKKVGRARSVEHDERDESLQLVVIKLAS